ncbi:class F sortase [Actinosynnema sp. CS-041913]|uniref:class F sortase n=1 Tax=Actinosynnema sp. CS-041913 TaxID=3239917 RepID=UPI003D94F956
MPKHPERGGLTAALLVFAAFVLGGCGSAPTPASAPASTASTPPAAVVAGGSAGTPVTVEIPRIGAKSSLIDVGLNPDGTLEVPPVDQPMQAAWYRLGPKPGETGPAVVLGHVDGDSRPGIFFRLRELVANDEVLVTDQTGRTRKFVVHRSLQVAKDAFPTEEVYGDTTGPELRVITCSGTFDAAADSYRDNTIVFARLAA